MLTAGLFALVLVLSLPWLALWWRASQCVVKGTLVATPFGAIPAEALQVGDELWTQGRTGIEKGWIVAKRSKLVMRHEVVSFLDGRHLGATAAHPIATDRGWVLAGQLEPGDAVDRLGASPTQMVTRRSAYGGVRVFDLTVQPNANFFANGILVHNKSVSSPESIAIGDLLSMRAAQAAYKGFNQGFYDVPECLAKPSRCIPGWREDQPVFLGKPDWHGVAREGYFFEFHAMAAPEERLPEGASSSSLLRWALTARPVVQNETGVRAFCVDSKEVVYFTSDGSTPLIDGLCDPSMNPLK